MKWDSLTFSYETGRQRKNSYVFFSFDDTILGKKEEVSVARRGNYRSDKRRKETDRLKKQEEKRQRRFARGREAEKGPETEEEQAGTEGESEEESE
jgi:FMN phosphatase YigB (HAD superfamily)